MLHYTRSVVTLVLGFVVVFWFVAQPDRPRPTNAAYHPADEQPTLVARDETETPPFAAQGGQVILTRASNGHFYTDAQVNGRTVHFLVDTGATTVALSRRDAEDIGLSMDPSRFTGIGRGANGTLSYMPVTLDSVGIGNLEEREVDGVVLDGNSDISLLGQSWLKRIRSVTIADDRMTLE